MWLQRGNDFGSRGRVRAEEQVAAHGTTLHCDRWRQIQLGAAEAEHVRAVDTSRALRFPSMRDGMDCAPAHEQAVERGREGGRLAEVGFRELVCELRPPFRGGIGGVWARYLLVGALRGAQSASNQIEFVTRRDGPLIAACVDRQG